MNIANPLKRVFILLLNYNGWQDTLNCLISLLKARKPEGFEIKIIVTDNGSSEEDWQRLSGFIHDQSFNQEDIELISTGRNLGFGGGNNVGIRRALSKQCDWILLLNNDTQVAPDFLEKLLVSGNPPTGGLEGFGILGSMVYSGLPQEDQIPNKIWFIKGMIKKSLIGAWHQCLGEEDRGQFDQKLVLESDFVTGACMLIKSGTLEKVGFFDENYFLYFEDVDFCLRAKKAGFKIGVVPCAKIWHKVSSSTKAHSFCYIYYHTRNALILNQKFGNILQRIYGFIWSAAMLLKQYLKGLYQRNGRQWREGIKRGIVDFYKGARGPLKL